MPCNTVYEVYKGRKAEPVMNKARIAAFLLSISFVIFEVADGTFVREGKYVLNHATLSRGHAFARAHRRLRRRHSRHSRVRVKLQIKSLKRKLIKQKMKQKKQMKMKKR